jgi:DNA-binding NtrC family response regulator
LAEVHAGRLRLDLYYRLSVVPLQLPPLREREGDLALLAQHFLSELSKRYGKQFQAISDAALQRLVEAPWPGNVRQLYHIIERIVVLHDAPFLVPSMLPAELDWQPPAPDNVLQSSRWQREMRLTSVPFQLSLPNHRPRCRRLDCNTLN